MATKKTGKKALTFPDRIYIALDADCNGCSTFEDTVVVTTAPAEISDGRIAIYDLVEVADKRTVAEIRHEGGECWLRLNQ